MNEYKSCDSCKHAEIYESAHEWLTYRCHAQDRKEVDGEGRNCPYFEKYMYPQDYMNEERQHLYSLAVGYVSQNSLPIVERVDKIMKAVDEYVDNWYDINLKKYESRKKVGE